MPEITKPYLPGTPNWVDIGVSDLSRSKRFYGDLFGWKFENMGPEMGDYHLVTLRNKTIAGMSQNPPTEKTPVRWTTYLATDDLESTIAKIKSKGGKTLTEIMEIPDRGRMVIAVDCCGASFGLWEQRGFVGSQLVNEPGTPVWNEMMSRDITSARDFYKTLFGYTFSQMDEPSMDYTTIDLNGRPVGGMYDGKGVVPDEVPSNWSVCFAVADTDDVVAKAVKSGAKIIAEPMDSPYGRFAALSDPDGAMFSVMRVSTSSPRPRQSEKSDTRATRR